ncbi:ATP-binding protein [Arenicella xantha]|uniref:Chemotaxis protein histidine kinase CheA n=1 Tax=Arenicella xantha TaxID=644221 RepID=A0A395JLN1_9GAMM|nr:ATP-binding protein [Arenicella xantha]RBP51706.1 chemotaxis protein histidine kinase CheA [Arenicella xantha]
MLLNLFGKYRFLVVSIALFLIFDLGVLVLNFYTSGKIAQQTELINLAARQSTLSQQMSKATLYIKSQKLQQWVYQTGLEELREHYRTFGETLDALTNGGATSSPETGELIQIDAVVSSEGQRLLAATNQLWTGFDAVLAPLMVDTLITDQEILPASEFIARHNLELFKLMTALTDHFSHQAESQTTLLRRAQVVGISLATINFFVILFHFLKQLRTRDRRLELKQQESEQILASIDDGVFLVDKQFRIGQQYSSRVAEIFATERISGRRLGGFLRHYVSDKMARNALDYVALFFKDHVSPDLIADINPLKGVKTSITHADGKLVEKYLDFTFSPLQQDDGSEVLLVTVQDITDSILLREQAEQSESRVQGELAMFSQVLPIRAAELQGFIDQSLESFSSINQVLKAHRKQDDSDPHSLEQIMQTAHKVKGDAQAIGLKLVGDRVHLFEDNVALLLKTANRRPLSGEDILPLTVELKQLVEQVELIEDFCSRLKNYGIQYERLDARHDDTVHQPAINERWRGLTSMAKAFAKPRDVDVLVNFRGFDQALDIELENKLYPIAVQLIRNSIAHGLEAKPDRLMVCKPATGRIDLALSHDGHGRYRFVIEDDGRGFDYALIREQLIKQGDVAPEAVLSLSNSELIKWAFSSRFSTREVVDSLSGRGMGLPLVWQLSKELGARLKVRSVADEFSQFVFTFTWSSEPSTNGLLAAQVA